MKSTMMGLVVSLLLLGSCFQADLRADTNVCASEQGSTSSYQFLNPTPFTGITVVSVKPFVSRLLIQTNYPINNPRTLFDGVPFAGQRISFTENDIIITAFANQNVGNDCGAVVIRAE